MFSAMKHLVFLTALLVTLTQPAAAQKCNSANNVELVGYILGRDVIMDECSKKILDIGKEAWERGDYATAWLRWLPLAEKGNQLAQGLIGTMYRFGKGVPQSSTEAAKWYFKAAEQGMRREQALLGWMYYKGEGVPQDYAKAINWFRKAADQMDTTAQVNLSMMYGNGQGVPRNYILAYLWNDIASLWINMTSSMKGHPTIRLTKSNRDMVKKRLTREELKHAKAIADDCWFKPVECPH